MEKNLKKNVCVYIYIYVYSRITLLYICNKHNTEMNYTPIKKKNLQREKKKTKKHNSSFYLSVITWNVNYFGWRKSSQ